MQRMDIQHHTPDQVSEYLGEALKIADDYALTQGERYAVLPTLLTLLSSKTVQIAQGAPAVTLPAMAIPRPRI